MRKASPTPLQMEQGAAITRTYLMKGLWYWLPVWETMGEPYTYPSMRLSPYPIGRPLHTWPDHLRTWPDLDENEEG
jgi:hypothetical protein